MVRFNQNFHEVQALFLQSLSETVDSSDVQLISQESQDTNDQSGEGCNHLHVQSFGYRTNTQVICRRNGIEDVDYSPDRTYEAQHWSHSGDQTQVV